jgi:hypothetical protein
MTRRISILAEPLYLLALIPLLLSSIVWAQEALWFKSPYGAVAVELLAFVAALAAAIYAPSLFLLSRIKRTSKRLLVSGVLFIASLLLAKYSVIAIVNWGFNTELRAYTSAVAVAASKRGLLLVLCAASIPLLLVPLTKLHAQREAKRCK